MLRQTKQQLHLSTSKLHQREAELQTVQLSADQQQPQQQLSIKVKSDRQHIQPQQDDVGAAVAAACAANQAELELLKEKLHDSVELLEEVDRQLREKVEEADDSRASQEATQQALAHSQHLLQDTKQQLGERTHALQEAEDVLQECSGRLQDAEQLLEARTHALQQMEGEQHTAVQQHQGQIVQLKAQLSAAEHRCVLHAPSDGPCMQLNA